MKVIVDNKIPYIREAIEQIADEVIYAPGKDFTPELVQDADAYEIESNDHRYCRCGKCRKQSS